MKTLFTAFLIFVFSTSYLYAQNPFRTGIKAGMNIASQSTTGKGENVEVENLVGFHFGGFFSYQFIDMFSVQPEIMVSQKGSNWKDPYFEGKDRLTYLALPVLLKFHPADMVNIHAGPEIGYLINAKQTNALTDEKRDVSEFYKNWDFGLGFGAEAMLPHNIHFTIRYILGLNIVTEEIEYWEEWKNKTLQISFGYTLWE